MRKILLPSSSFWMNILILTSSFPLFLPMLFINILEGKEIILYPVSCLPSSFRRFFLFPPILCLSFFFPSAKNLGISAASPKSPMPRFLQDSVRTLSLSLSLCSAGWLILPNRSATSLILPLPGSLPLIPPALNSLSRKTTPKPSMPLSKNSRLSIRISPVSILTKWLMASCLPRLQLLLMQNRCISTAIFCYADKFGILTNGLGIVRDIVFLDDDFKAAHPELPVEKKSDSPEEDKTISDSAALKPVLSDFFAAHPDFHPDTFLGDAAFDSAGIYGFLKNDFHFQKALIPYNPRNESTLKKVGFNGYGYPTCPDDPSLAMKYCGITKEKGRSGRIKWCCPKVHMVKGQWVCDCKDPCSTAKMGRTTYTYENMEFRMFPGIQRDSPEWDSLYKIRTSIERAINHFKTNMCVAGKRTRNHTTTKADVFLAGIASQLTVIVASRMNRHDYIRSLKPLVA